VTRRAAAVLLALAAAPAAAQPVDCAAETLPPAEVRFCAERAFETADAAMGEAYRLALTEARVFDETSAVEGRSTPLPLEQALREAQEAFLDYRNAACEAEAVTFRDGTAAPVAGLVCETRLTLRRTEDLRFFGEIE
jgi:uncharacterized protein YecT (DUF1311 family)